MNKEDLKKLINKANITVTGLVSDKFVENVSASDVLAKYATQTGIKRKKEIADLVTELDGGVPETPDVPEEPKTPEEVAAEYKDAITEGGDVTVKEDFTAPEVLTPTADLNLDLNEKTVTVAAGADFIDVKNVKVVMVNGTTTQELPASDTGSSIFYVTGSGSLELENVELTGSRCVYLNNANSKATIKSGKFTTLYNSAPAVYVQNGGKVVIEGGEFMADGKVENKYLLNLKDALVQNGEDPRDYIEVRGGTFYGYNPAESYSEPNGPVSFVAEGYHVEVQEDGGYKVVEGVAEVAEIKAAPMSAVGIGNPVAPTADVPAVDPVETTTENETTTATTKKTRAKKS